MRRCKRPLPATCSCSSRKRLDRSMLPSLFGVPLGSPSGSTSDRPDARSRRERYHAGSRHLRLERKKNPTARSLGGTGKVRRVGELVQLGGLEPPTSWSTAKRSNQLSYSCTRNGSGDGAPLTARE